MNANTGFVICLGDSHTEGLWGENWLQLLQPHVKAKLVNAGINGEMAYSMAKRLVGLLSTYGPDIKGVVLLAGTNDVLAQSGRSWTWYHKFIRHQVPKKPDVKHFTDSVVYILNTCSSKLPSCPVHVVTMPPIGDDLYDSINRAVEAYNTALKEVCQQHRDVHVVDYHDACCQHLRAQVASSAVATPRTGSLWQQVWISVKAFLQHHVLRVPWDTISKNQGLHLTVDYIHINTTAARILSELLKPFLQELQ